MNVQKAAERRKKTVLRLFRKYGNACYFCSTPLTTVDATLDHYVPRAAGGSNEFSNLRPACRPCNNDKADRVPNPDGSLPPKARQHRLPKAERPPVCRVCDAGRLLPKDGQCGECLTGPQPEFRPHYLKVRTWECDHEIFWCIACCLFNEAERYEMALNKLAAADTVAV